MSQSDTTPSAIAELARVIEVAASQEYVASDAPPRRMFEAVCGDGSTCHLMTGGTLIGGDVIYCSDHESCNECEGAYRAAAVVCAEKLHGYKLTLLGFALVGRDNRNDESDDNSTPVLALVGDTE